MAASGGEVRTRITADTSGFDKGLREAQKQVKGLADDLIGKLGPAGSVLEKLGGAAIPLAASIGAVTAAMTAAAAATIQAINAWSTYAGKIADLSARTGISTDALQKFKYAAEQTGSSLDQVSSAVAKMQVSLANSSDAFARIGLNVSELRRMRPEQQFEAVGDAIRKMNDVAARSAALRDIFGRSGVDLAPMLLGLRDLNTEAERLGVVMDESLIQKGDAVGDAWADMTSASEALKREFGALAGETLGVTDGLRLVALGVGDINAAFKETMAGGSKTWVSILTQDLLSSVPALGQFAQAALAAGAAARFLNAARSGTAGPAVRTPGFEGATDPYYAMLQSGLDIGTSPWRPPKAPPKGPKQKPYTPSYEAWWMPWMSGSMNEWNVPDIEKLPSSGSATALVGNITMTSKAVADFGQKLMAVGDLMVNAGRAIGGAIGDFISKIGGGAGMLAGGWDAWKTGGGGFFGTLSKLTGGIGLIGGAVSIGKALWGGIKGLFGGGDKKVAVPPPTPDERWKAASDAWGGEGIISAAMLQQLRGTRTKTMDQFVGSQLDRLPGAMTAMQGITMVSPEDAKAQATIFSASFWATVKERGMMAAVDAFRPAFEQLNATLTEGGFDVSGIFDPIIQLFQLGDNETFRGAIEGAQGLKDALEGISNAGYLTVDTFNAFQQQAQTAFDQAIAGGATAAQAYQAMAPMLQAIIEASNTYGLTIDANTQKLIEQAKENGVVFKTDPIDRLCDALDRLIEKLGGVGSAAGDAANNIGNIGNSGPHMQPESYATGGYIPPRPGGTLIRVGEAGEGEWVIPKSKMGGAAGVAINVIGATKPSDIVAIVSDALRSRGVLVTDVRAALAGA